MTNNSLYLASIHTYPLNPPDCHVSTSCNTVTYDFTAVQKIQSSLLKNNIFVSSVPVAAFFY